MGEGCQLTVARWRQLVGGLTATVRGDRFLGNKNKIK